MIIKTQLLTGYSWHLLKKAHIILRVTHKSVRLDLDPVTEVQSRKQQVREEVCGLSRSRDPKMWVIIRVDKSSQAGARSLYLMGISVERRIRTGSPMLS